MTVSSGVSALARQFMEMKAKRRCSILFHLLGAGGECATVIVRCSSLARVCKAFFHSLLRTPLLPPQSAVMSNSCACGFGRKLDCLLQVLNRRMGAFVGSF